MLHRDPQPEMMDDPSLSDEEHRRALAGLARLNRISGVARAMYRHIRRHALARADRRLCILDVASGSGDLPITWAKLARREGLNLQLTLLDTRPVAIQEQQRRSRLAGLEILSLQHDCLQSPLPSGFDVVTCSLFLHHLDEHQTFRLLQSMQAASDNAMIICDLERTRFNSMLVQLGSRVLSRSPIVHHDAAVSVRSAYTMEEFQRIAEDALARPIRVQRSFPCRFIAYVDEQAIPAVVPAFA